MKWMRFEQQWATAILEAIFPGSRESGMTGIRAMNVEGFLRELVLHLPRRAAIGLRLAVWLVALAPLWILRRFATIGRLEGPDRQRVVDALVASRSYAVRSLVLLLKTVGALLYVADHGVRGRMMPPRSALATRKVKGAHAV